MTPTETITILRRYNVWRRGNLEGMPQPDPREIGVAIDAAIEMIERAESDLATAEQDSRQKQARIERLEAALGEIARSRNSVWQSERAHAALEESK